MHFLELVAAPLESHCAALIHKLPRHFNILANAVAMIVHITKVAATSRITGIAGFREKRHGPRVVLCEAVPSRVEITVVYAEFGILLVARLGVETRRTKIIPRHAVSVVVNIAESAASLGIP